MAICEETKHRQPYRHRQLLDVCDVLSKHMQDSAAVHGHHVSKETMAGINVYYC